MKSTFLTREGVNGIAGYPTLSFPRFQRLRFSAFQLFFGEKELHHFCTTFCAFTFLPEQNCLEIALFQSKSNVFKEKNFEPLLTASRSSNEYPASSICHSLPTFDY